jgi:hypothetical protein
LQLVKESKLRTSTDIRELFEDGQKSVVIEVSHNQEEKMAVADSGGCAQGKNRPLLPPLEGYRIIWDIRPPLRKRPPLI